jgi:hypothetical protein
MIDCGASIDERVIQPHKNLIAGAFTKECSSRIGVIDDLSYYCRNHGGFINTIWQAGHVLLLQIPFFT